LLGSPRLLIVDEPTAGLDPAERNRFHRVLADVAADAVVLLSTHIVEDIENLCRRLSILDRGCVVAEGTPAELTEKLTGRLWTRTFLRGQPLPDNTLHIAATPTGTRVVVAAGTAPGPGYAPHAPRLEDVYHYALDRYAAGA
jgi:ABC-type multidrug transport system ATPase subunit